MLLGKERSIVCGKTILCQKEFLFMVRRRVRIMSFTKKAVAMTQEKKEVEDKEGKVFIRDTSDNKLFKSIQVKDISVNNQCGLYWCV